jgi:O-antigen/teichoic acid export membrane protein
MRNISLILQRLIFPILSRVQDENERMKNIHMQMIHMIASILTPIVVVIYFAGDDLIKVSFGEKWAPVVPFLYIIAMISLIGTLSVALKGAFLATGNTKVIMRVNALEALASTTGIAVGVIFGLTGVAVGQLLALILTFIVNLSMMMRHVGHRITDILSVFARIFASNAILYGVLFVMEYISILDLRSGVFLRLFVGAATYVLAIFVVDREIFTFVREAVREVRARGGGRIPRNSG